jgi:hypothetical protein
MRYLVTSTFICVCLLVLAANTFGQGTGCITSGADAGKRNDGNYYTDCFPWVSGDGTLSVSGVGTVHNDTARLRAAINAAYGKLIFNEADYYINDDLPLHSFMIIEGTAVNTSTAHHTSFITQTGSGKSIFKIAPGQITSNPTNVPIIQEIAIRDIGLKGNGSAGNYGIYATGGTNSAPGLFFQFTNVRFTNFEKGIYVNATDGGWQFDTVRLDKCYFEGNTIGVHVNSMNSGWTISGINMKVPEQVTINDPETMGFYFERSTYTSVNMATGNGPSYIAGSTKATVFIKIVRHGNISIQNAVSEGFKKDLIIDGVNSTTRNFPIALINNHFMHGISVKDSTVLSTGNQFGYYYDDTVNNANDIDVVAPVEATGDSIIYSVGDKFCFEGQSCTSGGNDYSKYRTTGNARLITVGGTKNSIAIGQQSGAGFEIFRSETDGTLTFKTDAAGFGYTFDAQYGNFTLKDSALNFNNGTITLGSTVFANINLGVTANGTLYYCSDCTATSTCGGGGSGAIAKRLNGAWVCN